ncbi:Oligoendopeptidase F, plasmid [compost metagenome]
MEQLPAWDNSTEYKALNSPDFLRDLEEARQGIAAIEELNKKLEGADRPLKIKTLQDISKLNERTAILLWNLAVYVNCFKSLDSTDELAKKVSAQLQQERAKFAVAETASSIALQTCDDSFLESYLQSEHTKVEAFFWKNKRKMKLFLLSSEEEKTLAQFETYGKMNWGELYSSLGGSLKVFLPSKGEHVGLAQAAGYVRGADAELRREAWQGIQAAWKTVEIPCAAVLNNLSGYRLEEYKKRSHTKKMHFLDKPLSESCIEAKTLEAMMTAVQERIGTPRRALAGLAKVFGKTKLDPWDLMAPSPRNKAGASTSYTEALSMIRDAFGDVDPAMGDFVNTMNDNKWIDARVLPNKSPGAYCTGFAKSNTPRVFQSYMGSMKDISTLAHELGHAYHNWVMRDMPLVQTYYPMTLAETASIFSETLLSERLFEKADKDAKFTIAWEDACDAVALLVNIPMRFDFEKSLYEARQNGPLSPAELNALVDQSWQKWYGDHVSQPESQYWMSKLHFSIAEVSFYNYPYTFGYLFGLGIYAQREKLGNKFHQVYVEILRDTGRMSAEDVIQKYLGMDIRQPKFWLDSLDMVEKKVAQFEGML